MATRKTNSAQTTETDTSTDANVPVFTTSTSTSTTADADAPAPAPAEPGPDEDVDADAETPEERDSREAAEATQVVSTQSGFATRELVLPVVSAPVFPAAMNAATLDGIPTPVDRTMETVTDPESGIMVSVPVDRADDTTTKDGDKA